LSFRPTRSELAWLGAIVLLSLAIYLPSLGNDPVFDDDYLTSGQLFTEYASPFAVKVRWLGYGTFVWLREVFGDGWWKQRLFTIGAHIATVGVLWGFYEEILRHIAHAPDEAGPPVPYALSPALPLAIGVFALNPVGVYAVAYLIQRSIVLATFFTVLALWLFAVGLRKRSIAHHAGALAAYVLAVAAKEHAILAPLAALPVYIIVARPTGRALTLVGIAGMLLTGAAALVLAQRYGDILFRAFDPYSKAYMAQLARLEPSTEKNAFALSVVNEAYLFFHYGLRWMLPWEGWMSINLRPPFPLTFTTFPHILGVFGYAAVVIGGLFLVIRFRTWPALVGLALLLPALLYPTEFATVWVQDPFVLYRSYLWGIGIPGLVFALVHGPPAKVLVPVAAGLAIFLVWQAIDRVISLSSPERAWTDAIAKLPKDPRSVGRWFPYVNRGSVYADHDQFAQALRDFEISESLGDTGLGAANSASLLSAKGRHAQALAALDRAEKQGYSLYNLHFQRGLAFMAMKRPADAYASFERVRALDPPSPTAELNLLNIGKLGLQLGKQQDAVEALEELVRRAPRNREGRYMLGMAYVAKKEYARAVEILDALLKEDRNRRAFYARALANFGLKRKNEALADIENAMRMGPEDPHLRDWHARIKALP
jgi:hypothetical protein